MKLSVSSILRFGLLAGVLSLVSAGGPYFPPSGCPTNLGWMQYGDYCYKFITQPGLISELTAACQSSGPYYQKPFAYLADIQSQAENDFVADQVAAGNRAWIGALLENGSFHWFKNRDEGNYDVGLTYTNWKPNEPNNHLGQENCIEINRGPPGKWNDLTCSRKRPGICKYSINEWDAIF